MKRLFLGIFLLSTAARAEKVPLAVYDLEAQGVPGATASIVTDVVRSELRSCGKYELIEKARMQEVLRLQGFQQTGCTEAECAAKLGKILNVKKMVVGGLGKMGESFRLSLRVVDVETAVIETEGAEKQALKEGDLDRLVPVLVSRLFCPEIKRPEIIPPPVHPESVKAKPVYKEIVNPIDRSVLIEHPLPEYPAMARQLHQEGRAFIQVLLDRDGSVMQTRLAKSSGYELLDQAAQDGAKKFKFSPAQQGDRTVRVWVSIPVDFRLEG